jgi:succinate-semialdehyde dehydrogenase/glutarate-semialdehyde dehydrogenase
MEITSINPANGGNIKTYTLDTPEQAKAKIAATQQAWLSWKKTAFDERKRLLHQMAAVIRKRANELAVLMANEMGKPITQGLSEVEKCAFACEYYADNLEIFLKDTLVETDASKSYYTYNPIGIVLAVMPWNFPLFQVFRFLVPALAVGNAGVLKHASNVPGCALVIQDIVEEAGFPKNIFQTLMIGSRDVEAVIENDYIKAVTLTGSNAAGSKVAAKAGELIKKTVLELGGSDAYVVLEDADIDLAAQVCVDARYVNSGQSCIAGKRFIVVKSVIEEFTKKFVEFAKAKIVGDPLDPKTHIGPQARVDLRDELHKQVLGSIAGGAKLVLGGVVPDDNTAFYPATVLTNVKPGIVSFDEELFGPVASIIEAEDEEHAIELANQSQFGLGSAVFTRDIARGEYIASQRLEAGMAFVNANVKSDPRIPFGGVKQSGYGRELSVWGIHEFVNVKTVFIK